ncbi:acyl-CoA dehydrogenase family protein [Mycobacterium sp. OTB74]|jgi:alkylation response protein AidB-like acyl-CoA dehydrogenase|uniref:acyl-CoA dehydrogenase family protein n=1 Tax=Mycobacterium sp. OTB74 TaxID=1853452 RepID=UPI0024743591|nr:acyl-CoA dehydrogenase family protein [Mycobacterium sp. OTB74]MDH6242731.1 alkylation response protein AidB-like acyl-CoA dehydrogenase [Mycobacterium sp. OTB74]
MNDLLSVARSLRPAIEAEADAVDREISLTKPVIQALAKSGLNHLLLPKELGGLEADIDTALDVFEEVAHQDGAVGWVFMANATATAFASMFDPAVARPMLEGRPEAVFAGQFVSRGRARRVDGGFEVSGRFQFGSGCTRATWIGGGALIRDEDGNLERNDAGIPLVLAFVVPADSVEITGNWDVMGLRGTGSFDYTIGEQIVEEGRTFWLFDCQPRCGGGMYHLGSVAFSGIGHAGWALGVARRALDEIQTIAMAGRARIGGTAMRDEQVFQRAFSENTLALRSARLLVHDTIGDMVRRLDAGEPMTMAMQHELVSAVTYQTRVCMDVVEFAYMASGSTGLRNPSILQRCFRDMCVGAAHLYVDPRTFDAMGKGLLGIE